MKHIGETVWMILMLAVFLPAVTSAAFAGDGERQIVSEAKPISYQDYLKIRSDQDVAVIDAYELEPFFFVGGLSERKDGMSSQKELDEILQAMIPDKKTKVVLFCAETFMPTRKVAANESVARTLSQMGYEDVYTLERFWMLDKMKVDGKEIGVDEFREKEVAPYQKQLPEAAKKRLTELHKALMEDATQKGGE